jgi:hypothetical protein
MMEERTPRPPMREHNSRRKALVPLSPDEGIRGSNIFA